MMIHLFINSIKSKEIYTKIDGANTSLCHALYPCNFENAANQIEKDDYVCISMDYIEDSNELEKLRILMNFALESGAVLLSNNMTINGTYYNPVGFSFIVLQSASETRIHNFHFTGFHTSILCFRQIDRGVLSMCTFTQNYAVGSISLLMFGVGKCKLDECLFFENSIMNTSLISMFSTHLYLNMTIIERNFVEHNSSQSLLYGINSVCEYTNTTIQKNSSPWAPLHKFEFRSVFGFWNCTWENNHHRELLLCDGTCEFNFTNTSIEYNHGSIITTSANSLISFNTSDVSSNFGGDTPLFDIPGGRFFTLDSVRFTKNSGLMLVDTNGAPGIVNISKAIFIGNQFDDSVVSIENGTTIIKSALFENNFVGNGVISLNRTRTEIKRSKFKQNRGTALKASESSIGIDSCDFYAPGGRLGNSIIAYGGYTSIAYSFFKGKTRDGHIVIKGRKRLLGLSFSAAAKFAVSKKVRSECHLCHFSVRGEKKYTLSELIRIPALMLVAGTALFCIGLVFYVRKFKNAQNPKLQ